MPELPTKSPPSQAAPLERRPDTSTPASKPARLPIARLIDMRIHCYRRTSGGIHAAEHPLALWITRQRDTSPLPTY